MMTPSGAFFDPECLKRLCNEFERMTLPIAEVNEPILDNRLTLEDELASHNKSRSVQLIQHFRSKSDSIEPKLLDQHSLARTVVLDDVAPLSPELDALLRVSKVTKLRTAYAADMFLLSILMQNLTLSEPRGTSPPPPTIESWRLQATGQNHSICDHASTVRFDYTVAWSLKVTEKKRTLDNLPTELYLLIFGYLNPIASTCFGLTCRKLYPLHRALHGSVSLATEQPVTLFGATPQEPKTISLELNFFLRRWLGPSLFYDRYKSLKIVRKDAFIRETLDSRGITMDQWMQGMLEARGLDMDTWLADCRERVGKRFEYLYMGLQYLPIGNIDFPVGFSVLERHLKLINECCIDRELMSMWANEIWERAHPEWLT